jgi:hypothetical protein
VKRSSKMKVKPTLRENKLKIIIASRFAPHDIFREEYTKAMENTDTRN